MLRCALLVVATVGCGGSDVPVPEDLFGTWAHVEVDLVRAFTFAERSDARPELTAQSPTYELYNYPPGAAPVLVQAGRYDVAERVLNEPEGQITATALVVEVAWDQAGTPAGTEFGNRIVDWDGDTLTLQVGAGPRRYDRVDALP